MSAKAAIVGTAQSKLERRKQESLSEIVYEVAHRALDDAGLSIDDIDGFVFAHAVEAFCGISGAGHTVVDSLGAKGKPMLANSTSGSTGVTTSILGYYQVASGFHHIVMVLSVEKMSECHSQQYTFSTIWDDAYARPLGINVPTFLSIEAISFMNRYGYTEEQMAKVPVKNRKNAFRNPYAQAPMDITVDDVLKSPALSWPIKLLDTCPVSDGACALIIASEGAAKEITDKPAWIKGVGHCGDSTWLMGRTNSILATQDYAYQAGRQAYEMAGIKKPQEEINVAEIYDPFSHKEMMNCESLQLCPEGGSARMLEEGISEMGGRLPVNPSGGLQGEGNPIAAAGTLRVAWAARQVRGMAGEIQVPNARLSVAEAWGGNYQFSAVMVLGNEK